VYCICFCTAPLAAVETSTVDPETQQQQPSPHVNELAPADFVRQSLGVEVVVVDRDQLNLPAARAGNVTGGLRIVQVVGPLAKLAGLKPGLTIVAIDGKPVTNFASTLQALLPHHTLVEAARLTMLRGDETIHAEFLLAPSGDDNDRSFHDPSGGQLTESDRQTQWIKSEYRKKVDLLKQELSGVEDLHARLGMTNAQVAAPAPADQRRVMFEARQDQLQQRIVDARGQLDTLDDEVADRFANHVKTNSKKSEAELIAVMQQRDAAERQRDELERTAARWSEQLETWTTVTAELKQRQHRVRVLQKGCASSVEQLRQLQGHVQDAAEGTPATPAATP
jgi:hypothetical protein